MKTAILKVVTDTPPPKVIAQAIVEGVVGGCPINSVVVVAEAVPRARGQHLDVDGILARSLPKLTGTLEKAA